MVILNTDVRMAINDETAKYVAVGSPLEVGMIEWLFLHRVSVIEGLQNRSDLQLLIPFSSVRKRMTVAYMHTQDTVRVVSKGAPEEIIRLCKKQLNKNC